MRISLICCIAVLLTLVVFPPQASADLVLYDDFQAEGLDDRKWFGAQTGTPGILLDMVRFIEGSRELRLAGLAFGLTGSNMGRFSSRVRLVFTKAALVKTIKAKVEVHRVQATGCPGDPPPNTTPTRAGFRISGFFFKSAALDMFGNPASGNTNDALAFIIIERLSNSTDPEGVLQVRAVVFHCGEPDCFGGTTLFDESMGTLMIGEETTLRLQWDPDMERFVFQRDDGAEMVFQYTLDDDLPASPVNQKRLEIAHDVANCIVTPPTPRPRAGMDVLADNVFVNPEAAP